MTLRRSYDLLGVGFGPANLALCAMYDSIRTRPGLARKTVGFIESRPGFEWHPEMLLDDARMQVSFLKDLVTLREPTSPYSFINYLHERGRLTHFLNLHTFYATRAEYHDYFVWAAALLKDWVAYHHQAESISPIIDPDGVVRELAVSCIDHRDGERHTVTASNLAIGVGGRPVVPSGVSTAALEGRAFHSSSFLSRIQTLVDPTRRAAAPRATAPLRFLVVGAGQSAAEIFVYLAREFPEARVDLVFRGFALMPANSSPLANEIFNPEMVDLFYGLGASTKQSVLQDLRTTNYAAVDDDVIEEIARRLYQQRLDGSDRLSLQRFSEFVSGVAEGDGVVASVKNLCTASVSTRRYDAVVFGTGYDFRHAELLLDGLEPYIERTNDGAIPLRRDYSIASADALQSKVFLQGAAEQSHGLTSTLISLLPHRAHDILSAAFVCPMGPLRWNAENRVTSRELTNDMSIEDVA